MNLRLALKYCHSHVELIERHDALLWSINEQMAGRGGLNLPRLSNEWKTDLLLLNEIEAAEIDDGPDYDDDDIEPQVGGAF